MKYLTRIQAYFNRLWFAWLISKEKNTAVIAIVLKREDIHAVYNEKDADNIQIKYMGLHPFIVRKSLRMIGKGVDETQLVLDKAQFEAEVEGYIYN